MQEAAGISSLKPELDRLQVPVYGLLNSRRGVEEFQPYLKGELLYDKEVCVQNIKYLRNVLVEDVDLNVSSTSGCSIMKRGGA